MEWIQSTTFMAYLEQVPDPRHERGKQYEWAYILAIITAALLSGNRTGRAIAQWARWHLTALRPKRKRIPSDSTFYRALRQLDLEVLERQVATYTQALAQQDPTSGCITGPQGQVWCGQALDGKALRGVRAQGRLVHLLSLVRHESGMVLAQAEVMEKSNEITAAPDLLAGQTLSGTVTTMDALLTQRALAEQILARQGHYLMVVKENQPRLYEHIDLLFRQPPVPAYEDEHLTCRTTDKGHGRIEVRTLESSTALNDYLDWPGVAQVLRRHCRRVCQKTGEVSETVTYGLTSLSREEALPPQLAQLWRGHWTIENQVHYVRDETFGEDRCQMHTGSAPQALAALRNGILSLLRHQGWSHIADAIRFYSTSVHKALHLIGAVAT
jgi:predicted transposase YbfD/YdcC